MQRYPTPNTNEIAGILDRRAEALLIDGLFVALAVGVLAYAAGVVVIGGPFGGYCVLLLSVQFGAPIVLLLYQTSFEGYYGQTIGKRARGIVVRKEGSRCTWGAAVLRNLLRIVDALLIFYFVGTSNRRCASHLLLRRDRHCVRCVGPKSARRSRDRNDRRLGRRLRSDRFGIDPASVTVREGVAISPCRREANIGR
ncbi:RDD family protein [Natrinema halophilum]|uniref:RDD family protein n=1 Tax=Natrinema halophilum TaxID=1699371 RepID=UPI001F3C7814|nr:RDD family protein [Natrinema halophilum]UHQ96013.1 RDD family protein [Natrinema halophilum]